PDTARDEGKREPRGIGFEIRGHLVLSWVVVRARRERHSRKSVVSRRREQTQGVPAPPPRLADALVALDDDEIAVLGGQVVRGGQTSLPPADDHRVDALTVADVSPPVPPFLPAPPALPF